MGDGEEGKGKGRGDRLGARQQTALPREEADAALERAECSSEALLQTETGLPREPLSVRLSKSHHCNRCWERGASPPSGRRGPRRRLKTIVRVMGRARLRGAGALRARRRTPLRRVGALRE